MRRLEFDTFGALRHVEYKDIISSPQGTPFRVVDWSMPVQIGRYYVYQHPVTREIELGKPIATLLDVEENWEKFGRPYEPVDTKGLDPKEPEPL